MEDSGETWKIFDNLKDPGISWRTLEYPDYSWKIFNNLERVWRFVDVLKKSRRIWRILEDLEDSREAWKIFDYFK